MIVVEGPDGAGKTTLVNELCREFGLQRVGPRLDEYRDKNLPKKPRERVYKALSWAVEGETLRVHDRLFWSECIYGPILRGESKFTLLEEHRIMELFRALQCPVIFVRRSWDECLEEVRKNPPQLEGWDENNAWEIWEKYIEGAEAAAGKKLNAITYDRQDRDYFTRTSLCTTLDALETHVASYLKKREEWTV